jgi:hypothetical protein
MLGMRIVKINAITVPRDRLDVLELEGPAEP